MLELTILTVPDCPNEPVLRDRLAQVLADHPDATVTRRVIQDEAGAARYGMHGSPTLLVNGFDPFAAPGTPASVSCRLYRDQSGPVGGAPSVAALREALRRAAGPPVPAGLAEAIGRAGRGRLAPVEGGLRAVHQRVLRAFAETGQPPSGAALEEAAAPYGVSGQEAMRQLHAADFLRLDACGAISAAYPFSPAPTPHLVTVQDGPQVYSMCAIDALGIAAMLGRTVTISSFEPGTGTPVTVTVPGVGEAVVWEPGTAVVFYGQQETACGTCPPDEAGAVVPPVAADTCCGAINFFTANASAAAWARAHPEITGKVLDQREAWQAGVSIFGPLLQS
jgi:hypothetical protein